MVQDGPHSGPYKSQSRRRSHLVPRSGRAHGCPARGGASRDRLKALGYQVQWHEYPMQHSVSAEELGDIAAFLTDVLRR